MTKLIVTALVVGALSLCSSLVLLFSGDGVKMFSDVSQVQYAVALITAIATALGIIKAQLTESPAQAGNKQSGFFTTQLAGALIVLAIAVIALPACTTQQITPNKMIAAASLSIEQIGEQIGQAQKSGQISNAREDRLIDELKQINADLRFAQQISGPLQTQSLQAINERLTAMQAELAKEKRP